MAGDVLVIGGLWFFKGYTVDVSTVLYCTVVYSIVINNGIDVQRTEQDFCDDAREPFLELAESYNYLYCTKQSFNEPTKRYSIMFNATKRSRLRIFQKLLTGWNHNGVVVSPYVSSASTGRTLHSDSADLDVKLYQYTICPFCNKAKALLAYADIDYSAIEVNPLTKAEIKWSKEYRKVPILTVNKQNLFGSDEILHGLLEHDFVKRRLEQKWEGMQSSLADFQNESAKKWIKFSNDELAPLLYPNICRTLSDSYTAFGYVQSVDTFTPFQKIVIRGIGSLAMYLAASKIKSKWPFWTMYEKV